MPLQSTFASNTVKGYRTASGLTPGDPHWDDVVLLIQPRSGDTEAIDYSGFNTTITAQRQSKAGVLTQTDPYGDSRVVLNFQPSNNHMVTVDQVADRIAASTDPDTWTMEGWFNTDDNSLAQQVMFGMHGNTYSPDNNPHVDNFVVFWMGNNSYSSNVPKFYAINENGSTAEDVSQNLTAVVNNQWYHLAIVNNGGTLSYYIDGTRVVYKNGYTLPTVRSDDSFQLGADQDNTTTNDFFNGQCSEFRVTRNIARYTGASFSVPTSRFLQAGGIVGGSAEFPATTEAEAITYLNTQNGSSSTSLIWLKHPQVNGNTPYRVSAIIDQGYVYALSGKMGSQNMNTQTVTATGKPAWMWNNNPGGSTTNDWGTDTHTFNASNALDTGDLDLSQRSRNWPELASRYKRVYYSSIDTVGTGDVIYKGTRGTTAHGPTLSWGELMEQVPAYALNNADSGESHKFPNEAGVAVAAMSRVSTGSGLSATQFDHLYLGMSDNESVPTATNDCAMIVGRTGLVQKTTPTFASNQSPAIFGLGCKRSSFNTSTGFAETNASPPALPSDSSTSDAGSGNTHGMICPFISNGRMDYDLSATVTFYTRFQCGDGSTAAKAFEGSPGDLDKIWYGGSIPDGLYYFKSTNSNLGTVRLRVENGFAKIPTGTSSISGSTVTSATLTNSNFFTKYYDGSASSNASELVFDASNRFSNIGNSATSPNSALGYILFDLGIPFRRSFIELTVQSATASGSGADNADWDGTADSTGWTAGNLTYAGLSGTPDLPFAVVPTNDTNQFRTLSGHTTNNSSTVASGGWTSSGDEGNVTRSWTSTVFDCGQAAERTQFGFGFMGFNGEEYRFNEGFWYLR